MWKACERFGIIPPGIVGNWNDNGANGQAMLLKYDWIRDHDTNEYAAKLATAGIPTR